MTPPPHSRPPLPTDEWGLLELARAGDERAVDAILRSHVDGVHAVCRRLCRDPDDAQDATQDALMAIARGLSGFDGRSSLSTWVYRVPTNACLDELRRKRRRPVPVDDDDHAEPASADPSTPELALGS